MKWPCVSIPSLYGFDLGYLQPGPPQPPVQPPPQHLLLTPVGKRSAAAPAPWRVSGKLQPAEQADDAGSDDAGADDAGADEQADGADDADDALVAAVRAQIAVPMGARK